MNSVYELMGIGVFLCLIVLFTLDMGFLLYIVIYVCFSFFHSVSVFF